MNDFIDIQERPSLGKLLPLSFQHLFAMFGSTVLVPYLLKVDPATALFMNGIGTLLYLFVCKGKIPAYLGSSFAFIAPVSAVLAAGLGYEAAKGAFVVFGLSFVILSFLVRYIGIGWIDKLFPPAAMGAIVAIIGLELAPVAMGMAGLMGVVDFSAVEAAPWFSLPQFYGMPEFDINAIVMIMPALFVVFAEHVGHLVVTSNIVSKDLMKEPGLERSLLGDGLANILSGFFGATPNTTYGENIGVLAITRCFSVWVIGGAAILAMIISFVGKVAALIHAIPIPVMGGVSILLFGIIAASGLRMLVERKVDYTNPVNMILTSVILVVGLSGAQLVIGPVVLKGMGLATVVGMGMSIVLLILQKTGIGNDQLKKTDV